MNIELESNVVRVGDTISGRVIPADKPCTVELAWHTHGQCEGEEKVVASTTTAEGAFTLAVPAAGPMSYAGKRFSVSWCVRTVGETSIEKTITVESAEKPADTP